MADRAVTLDFKPAAKHTTRVESFAAPSRRIRTGPLPTLPRGDLAPVHGFEGKLPLLLLTGLGVLAAIQISLAL